MPSQDFFPQRPDSHPSIYAYKDTNPNHNGLLKVGYTTRDVEVRVCEQFPVIQRGATLQHRFRRVGSSR